MIEVVCAVLVDGEGEGARVLAALRPDGGHLGGRWEFPGGKIEDGEWPESALHREILEELGCRLIVDEALDAVEHEYDPRRRIRLLPFLCRPVAGSPPRPLHHAELRWLEPHELLDPTIGWAEADRPILAEVVRRLGGRA